MTLRQLIAANTVQFVSKLEEPAVTYYLLVESLCTMERMQRIKDMADYDCRPLWRDVAPNGDVGDIDPLSLPIDPCLQARLLR